MGGRKESRTPDEWRAVMDKMKAQGASWFYSQGRSAGLPAAGGEEPSRFDVIRIEAARARQASLALLAEAGDAARSATGRARADTAAFVQEHLAQHTHPLPCPRHPLTASPTAPVDTVLPLPYLRCHLLSLRPFPPLPWPLLSLFLSPLRCQLQEALGNSLPLPG